MNDEALAVGDTVRLKSGGELMTIETINDKGTAVCVRQANGETKEYPFNVATLERSEKPRPMSR